ncbi:hypothetical protein D3C72_1612930 [compost metagenome]
MAGAKALRNIGVILAALVGIANQQRDWRAGGLAFVDARENLDLVWLVALRHVLAGTGAAAVQIVLDVCFAQRHARGAAINHTADGRAVGFAKVGDSE